MNVLVIPEDFRKDQYMLKPIISAMLSEIGRVAKIRVCQDPLLGGIGQALKWVRINEILDRYKGMVHLFLLCVDRDGIETRKQSLNSLEEKASEALPEGKLLLAENAWQEIEIWCSPVMICRRIGFGKSCEWNRTRKSYTMSLLPKG